MTSSITNNRLPLGKNEPVRFNIMIVGERGLGKKTFIKSLFKSYYNEDDIFSGIDENLQNQDIFTSNLYGLLQQSLHEYPSHTVHITETGSITLNTTTGQAKFHLYNAHGYGDNINNGNDFSIIKNDIINRHIQWRKLDAQILNDQSRSLLDNRIHCLLYFISPHRFKKTDLTFFEQLSDVVSIVPVISKCDCLTSKEKNAMLLSIDKELKALSNTKGFNVCYDFRESEHMNDNLSDTSLETSNKNYQFAISSPIKLLSKSETTYSVERYEPGLIDIKEITSSNCNCIQVPNIFAVPSDLNGMRCYSQSKIPIYDDRNSDFRRLQQLLFEQG